MLCVASQLTLAQLVIELECLTTLAYTSYGTPTSSFNHQRVKWQFEYSEQM